MISHKSLTCIATFALAAVMLVFLGSPARAAVEDLHHCHYGTEWGALVGVEDVTGAADPETLVAACLSAVDGLGTLLTIGDDPGDYNVYQDVEDPAGCMWSTGPVPLPVGWTQYAVDQGYDVEASVCPVEPEPVPGALTVDESAALLEIADQIKVLAYGLAFLVFVTFASFVSGFGR